MHVSFIKPEAELSPYIAFIWVFESNFGLPSADSRIIVPDGRAKIIIPYRNDMRALVRGQPMRGQQHQLLLVGIQDSPVTISPTTMHTGTIGVELTPKGLYHFFNLHMVETANRIVSFEELFDSWGKRLQERVSGTESPQEKVALLQTALAHLLQRNTKNYSLLDYTLDVLNQTPATLTIQALEAKTGYSKRYLDKLFRTHVGVAPKSLAAILRFQKIYHLWMRQKEMTFSESSAAEYYYDQSHFIKEFKRFTGFTPRGYKKITNEFGKAFELK